MDLRIFLRHEPSVIRANESGRETVAKQIAEDIVSLMDAGGEDSTFPLLGSAVTFFGQRWGEKWVEFLGEHLHLYATRGKPGFVPGLPQGSTGPRAGRWRTSKSLSGDVNGAIAETLFALLMRQEYNQRARSFAHLRPLKTMTFPDFEIIDASAELQAAFNPLLGRNFGRHFPAEVKASAHATESTVAERAFKALNQINSYWTERDRKDGTPQRDPDGIAAIFVRNIDRESYDAFLYAVT